MSRWHVTVKVGDPTRGSGLSSTTLEAFDPIDAIDQVLANYDAGGSDRHHALDTG